MERLSHQWCEMGNNCGEVPLSSMKRDSSFTRLVDRVLSVSKDEILRREAEYRKQVEANLRLMSQVSCPSQGSTP
jgi:hypothetical protein